MVTWCTGVVVHSPATACFSASLSVRNGSGRTFGCSRSATAEHTSSTAVCSHRESYTTHCHKIIIILFQYHHHLTQEQSAAAELLGHLLKYVHLLRLLKAKRFFLIKKQTKNNSLLQMMMISVADLGRPINLNTKLSCAEQMQSRKHMRHYMRHDGKAASIS